MKIVKSISLITVSLLVLITSCEDDTLSTVGSISVSQGTYVGVVHVNWDPVPDAAYYNIERKGPDGAWINAGTVNAPPFDDYGFGLPDNRLVEGAKYTYRISSASGDADDSPYSEPTGEGWIYEFQPIAMQAMRQDDGTIILSWTDATQNLVNQSNLSGFKYIVKRRYEDETSFKDLFTTDFMSNVQTLNYTDDGVASDKKAFYDIQGRYQYVYKNMDMGSYEAIWTKDYSEVQESGGTIQANYTFTQLNNTPGSVDGYGFVMLKDIQDEMYAATIAKPALGNPKLCQHLQKQ